MGLLFGSGSDSDQQVQYLPTVPFIWNIISFDHCSYIAVLWIRNYFFGSGPTFQIISDPITDPTLFIFKDPSTKFFKSDKLILED